ncbi:AraC family transcriptional regulator [Paenibacillus lignilyticus]|uniref:AraC family transcriptional regulator n=1 Tax=Paenibacillus lignilyticus TaxID=1172615 RepID=A0ABS5CFI8_9BACL|nr:AraC family transcriptional regulator [Paenibacillus lignilyticus]MBP3964620.1 AraC family transcriptional regulator [Paenibacillus lignilyticus]
MKPIRKHFDAQPSFPFAFTFKDRKTLQRELPDHLHDWFELVYVYSGEGTFFIDRTIYDMNKGDLFIIPGNTIHRAFPDKEDPVTSTALFFHPMLLDRISLGESFSYMACFEQSRMSHRFKMECSSALQQSIERALVEVESELRTAQAGYRHAIVLHVEQLLLAVNREIGGERKRKAGSAFIGPSWMKDSLLYIDQHFTEAISLSKLSQMASVSSAHFSRVFKQSTGMNVTAFITAKRIVKAKELLLEEDDPIAAIAEACGFESMPYFHRVFKQIVGMTPSAYRHRS